jgi:uncharacterized membrane protein YeiH
MMRDLFLRRIPRIFGGNTLYATSAVLASGVMVILYKAGYPSAGLILATVTGAALTLLAMWRGWQLPEAYVAHPIHVSPRPPRLHRARQNDKHSAPKPDSREQP